VAKHKSGVIYRFHLTVPPLATTLRKIRTKLGYDLRTKFHLSFSFYIILSGKVAIYINNALADEDNLTGTVEEEEIEKKEKDLLPGEEKKKKKLDRSKFGNYIAQIGKLNYEGVCQKLLLR
jgi:hypothetical protein